MTTTDNSHLEHQHSDNSASESGVDGQSALTKPASFPTQSILKLKQFTDVGNAKFFVTLHKDSIRYCKELKTWFVWDGKRWASDRTGEIQRKAKETALRMFGLASQGANEIERQRIAKHAYKTQSEQRLNSMLNLAQTEASVSILPEDLDSDPWLLNVANGTLNLKSGQLRQFKKSDLITKLTPITYDANATCPRWDKFLLEIMGGDLDKIRYLQKIVGYSLTGSTNEQVFFIFYGSGENGKTTFIKVIMAILGEYAKNTPITTFLRKNPNSIPHDIARLQGARFVTADETEEGSKLAEAQMKHLTGGGAITARNFYSGLFSFESTFKIVLDVNHLPAIGGTEHAMWRRVRAVPFEVTIPAEKKDRTLFEKLKAELPGILKWAVDGALLWQKEGLEPPESITRATNAYREDQNLVRKFVDDRCDNVPGAVTPFSDLYKDFKEWCTENGETVLSAIKLGRGLDELKYDKGRKAGSGTKVRYNIRLRPFIQNV